MQATNKEQRWRHGDLSLSSISTTDPVPSGAFFLSREHEREFCHGPSEHLNKIKMTYRPPRPGADRWNLSSDDVQQLALHADLQSADHRMDSPLPRVIYLATRSKGFHRRQASRDFCVVYFHQINNLCYHFIRHLSLIFMSVRKSIVSFRKQQAVNFLNRFLDFVVPGGRSYHTCSACLDRPPDSASPCLRHPVHVLGEWFADSYKASANQVFVISFPRFWQVSIRS